MSVPLRSLCITFLVVLLINAGWCQDDRAKLIQLHAYTDSLQLTDLDFHQVLELSLKGVDLAYSLNEPQLEADFHRWIIRSNSYLFKSENSYASHRRTEELFAQGAISLETFIRSVYGEAYTLLQLGEFEEAQEKLMILKELNAEENDKTKIYYVDLLATLETEREDFTAAEDAMLTMLRLAQEGSIERNVSIAYIRLTTHHLEKTGDFAKALLYARQGIEHALSAEMASYVSHLRLLKARAHLALEAYDDYRDEFSKIELDPTDAIFPKDYWLLQGDYHSKIGEKRSATNAYGKAYALVDTNRRADYLEILDRLSAHHFQSKNFSTAYRYQANARRIQQIITQKKSARSLNYLEYKVEDANEQMKMMEVEEQLRIQRNRTKYGMMIIVGLVLFLLAWLWQVVHYNKRLTSEVSDRTEVLNAKSMALEKNLEELQQFNYIASHDIKEPMRVVSNLSALIERGIRDDSPDRFREEFEIINKNLNQLYTLLEDLTSFNHLQESGLHLEDVVLDELVHTVLGLFSPEKLKRLEVVTHELPKVHTSRALLTLVFKNLIDNAIKFNNQPTTRLSISGFSHDAGHTIRFEDNGPGIDPKYRDKIFNMFGRLHGREIPGSGMGLGIARKVLENLGGTISLGETKVAAGAVFEIQLPRSIDAAVATDVVRG